MSEDWKNADEDVQMPLGVGGGEGSGGAEYTDEPSKPKVNGPTVVLFAAFAAGLLVIYLLGMQSKPRAATADQLAHEAQVKSAIADLLGKNGKADQLDSLFRDTDKLMKMFHAYFGGDSKEAPELAHDPFANDDKVEVPSGPAMVTEVPNEKLKKVAETFATLKLQSVMLGRTPIAMVNNRMLTINAKIGDLTVASIEANRVIFKYGENRFELKLAQASIDQ
ncbi:MAG: hypothetical protein ACTHN5_03070 [Phycisphaerae bacterium]